MSNVPTNLIPTRVTGLPEYLGTSTLGYLPYIIDGRTYKVQFANIAAVGAVPSTREINTGSGLGGGGDLSVNRTLYILPGGVDDSRLSVTGVAAGTYGAADTVPVLTINAQGRVTSATSAPIVLSNYVPTSRIITAGAGLTGGGDLSANRSFAVNFSSTTPEPLGPGSPGVSTVAARGDHVHPAVDLSDTTETQGVLPLSRGGTGNSLSPVVGAIAYSSNDKLYLTSTAGSAGQVLTSAGGTGSPYWQTITGTGTVTSVNASGGTTGLSFSGGPITAAGTLTLGGTLAVANGGTGATTAAAARTNLGATTIGGNVFTLANPSAITFPRFNADNTVSALDAASFRTAIGAGTSSTTGTVTSVSGTGTVSGLSLSGTVTSTGSLTLGGTLAVLPSNFASQSANTVLAAPNGSAGVPTFRAIVAADIPTLNQNTTGTAANVTGIVAVANGGTGASVAGTARTNLGAAASGANTDITSIALTTGTISATPTNGTDIVNKLYADSIAAGINFHQSVRLATAAALPANTYNNGSSGVGATLTANAIGALTVDGVAAVAGNRILVKNEVTQANNGVYTVTQVGNGSTPYILTRATDFDTAGAGVNKIDAGDFFLVTAGSTQSNTSWVQQTPLPIVVGTTALVFTQFAAPVLYSAGTGLTLAGTVFSITNTGVSASTYGSASSVPVLAINAQGQVTSASASSIAIAASQITSGTVTVAQGGTGATTLGANGVLLGNGTSAISATAVGTTGQVLVGNTGAAPTWATLSTSAVTSFSAGTTGLTPSSGTTGAITLAGTLNVANGGTGGTTAATARTNLGATTVGGNFFTLTNPSAITFPRINVDNTVSALDAATFRTAIGAGTSSTTGTVTSVAGTGTVNGITLTGTVTSSGSLTLGGTLSGVSLTTQVTGTLPVANGGTGATSLTSGYLLKGNGTSAVSASVVYDDGTNVGIGTSSPASKLDIATGDLRFSGTGQRILGDMSNATFTSRFAFQTSTVNGNTNVHIIPNGTSTIAGFKVESDPTFTNGQTMAIDMVGGTDARISSNIRGTGTYVPLTFYTGGSERMRIDTIGNLLVGTTTAVQRLTIGSTVAADAGINQRTTQTDFSITPSNSAAGGVTISTSWVSGGQGPLIFTNANGEIIRFDASRNVLVGATAQAFAEKLRVFGNYSVFDNGTYTGFIGAGNSLGTATATDFAFRSSNAMAFLTGGATERMRIDASGNVGIGTTSLSAGYGAGKSLMLTNQSGVLFQNASNAWSTTTTGGGVTYYSDNNLYIDAKDSASNMIFRVNGATERMRITSVGDVGIGTSAPAGKFHIVTGTNDSLLFRGPVSLGTGGSIFAVNAANSAIAPMEFAASVFYFNAGNVGIGTTSPSALLQLNKASGASDLRLSVGGTLYTNIYASSSDVNILGITAIPLILGTNNTERMRILSGGDIGIGTSTPATKLEVNGGLIAGAENRQSHPPTGPVGFKAQWNFTGGDGETDFYNLYSTASTSFRFYQTTGSGTAQLLYNMRPTVHEFYTGGTLRFSVTSTGGITSSDLADAVGYKGLPQNGQSASYTLALSDMGKHISITTGGVVIPANGTVAFPIGSTIVVFNNSGSNQTISITTDTLRLSGSANTGSRTLAQYGLATLVKVAATVWVASGAGLT